MPQPHPAQLEPLQLMLHDIQTPVAVLDASFKLLESDLRSASPDVLNTLRDAQRACHRIRQYVDHLVSTEVLDRGGSRRRVDRVELGSLLSELLSEYSAHALAVGLTLTSDLAPAKSLSLKADRTLLERVFQNLLENSLRHNRTGGRVHVEARGGSVIEVRVCNDGEPIAAADKQHLFQKFTGHSPTGGLGLYICKLAVEVHGGTIMLQDHPDWPVCFVVRLPVACI